MQCMDINLPAAVILGSFLSAVGLGRIYVCISHKLDLLNNFWIGTNTGVPCTHVHSSKKCCLIKSLVLHSGGDTESKECKNLFSLH